MSTIAADAVLPRATGIRFQGREPEPCTALMAVQRESCSMIHRRRACQDRRGKDVIVVWQASACRARHKRATRGAIGHIRPFICFRARGGMAAPVRLLRLLWSGGRQSAGEMGRPGWVGSHRSWTGTLTGLGCVAQDGSHSTSLIRITGCAVFLCSPTRANGQRADRVRWAAPSARTEAIDLPELAWCGGEDAGYVGWAGGWAVSGERKEAWSERAATGAAPAAWSGASWQVGEGISVSEQGLGVRFGGEVWNLG